MTDHESAMRDRLLDYAATVYDTPARAARRDRAMERAHAAGLPACEVCGCAIDTDPVMVAGAPVGPSCARIMRRAGLIT